MGNCVASGKPQFVVNDNVPGQGTEAQEVFNLLELSAKDINFLYSEFCKVDVDGGGTIMNLELYFHLLKDRSIFLDTVFSLFDDDRSGQLDFLEFVVSLWCLCTLSPQHIGGFAFLMCDSDGSGDLNMHEITAMFEILYPNGGSQQCLSELKNDVAFEGTLNVLEFIRWTQNKMSVMSPLLRLQATLQQTFGGSFFWRRLATARAVLAEEYLRHPKCIAQLRLKVREVRDRTKELRRLTEKKKVLAIKAVANKDPKKGKLMDKYVKMVTSGTEDLKKELRRQEEEEKRNADPLKAAMKRFNINVNDPKPKEFLTPSTAAPGTNPFRDKLFDKQEQRKERRALRELRRSGKSVVPVGSVEELLLVATGQMDQTPGSPKIRPISAKARPVSASAAASPQQSLAEGSQATVASPIPAASPVRATPVASPTGGAEARFVTPVLSPVEDIKSPEYSPFVEKKRSTKKRSAKGDEAVRGQLPSSALEVEHRERARSSKQMVGREFDNHRKLAAGPSIMMLNSSMVG
jgi:Ca2+-binding EF-hand superfamily protein